MQALTPQGARSYSSAATGPSSSSGSTSAQAPLSARKVKAILKEHLPPVTIDADELETLTKWYVRHVFYYFLWARPANLPPDDSIYYSFDRYALMLFLYWDTDGHCWSNELYAEHGLAVLQDLRARYPAFTGLEHIGKTWATFSSQMKSKGILHFLSCPLAANKTSYDWKMAHETWRSEFHCAQVNEGKIDTMVRLFIPLGTVVLPLPNEVPLLEEVDRHGGTYRRVDLNDPQMRAYFEPILDYGRDWIGVRHKRKEYSEKVYMDFGRSHIDIEVEAENQRFAVTVKPGFPVSIDFGMPRDQ